MLNTQSKSFITQDEAIVAYSCAVSSKNESLSYCGMLSLIDVLEIIYKETCNCFKIIKINLITNEVTDITETVADMYIFKHEAELNPDDFDNIPDFIANSDAWEQHMRYLTQEAADDKKYGTYEEQHRLRLSDVL